MTSPSTAELHARVRSLARELSASGPAVTGILRGDAVPISEAAWELSGQAIAQLSRTHDSAQRQRLSRTVAELQRLLMNTYVAAHTNSSRRLESTSRALSRLRAATSIAELVERVCAEAVAGSGFDRVVLSRLSGRWWTPWLAHAAPGAELAGWFPSWAGTSIELTARMPERQAMTARAPVLVSDTSLAPVYRPIIIEAGRSDSYVVAPVIADGHLVGLLHADHASAARADDTDLEVLDVFASGLGFLYERVALQDALREQRLHTRDRLLAAAEGIMTFAQQHPDASARPVVDGLTPRELDVLRLLAEGVTNAAIADRLMVSVDTVKSHVKHILRKLGVANRAQAVTRYYSE